MSLDADKLVQSWCECFSEYSYNNEVYSKIALHLLLGQILRRQKIIKHGIVIDGRFNIFLIQSSGSGKSTPLSFIIDNAEFLGLDFQSITDWSDAALIGTIESKQMEETGKVVHEKVTGFLQDVDILHIDEASLLFAPTKYNQSTLSLMQIALNPIGSPSNRIRKKLRVGEWIEVYPHCSLFLTSYNLDKVTEIVTKRGIMQRIAIFVRFLDADARLKNAYKDIEYLGTPMAVKEATLNEVKNTLKVIADSYLKRDIEIDDKVKPLLKTFAKNLYDMTANLNPYLQEQVHGFLPRYLTMIYVLSMHHAAMRQELKVNEADVKYAYGLVRELFASVIAWLENEMSMDLEKRSKGRAGMLRTAIAIFDKHQIDGKISLAKFARLIEEHTGRSRATIYRDLKDPMVDKYLVINYDNKSVRRKVNEK